MKKARRSLMSRHVCKALGADTRLPQADSALENEICKAPCCLGISESRMLMLHSQDTIRIVSLWGSNDLKRQGQRKVKMK